MSNTKLVDTHAHLTMLSQTPVPEGLLRARAAGVEKIISVSTDESNWEGNRKWSEEDPDIYYTLGLHPHDAKKWCTLRSQLESYFGAGVPPKCVGVGELGLDYHYNLSTPSEQTAALEGQFEVARRVELPVVIHCRDAFDDLYSAVSRLGLSARGGVMHCFTGDVVQAKRALDLGLMISFSGIVTFKTAAAIQNAAKTVPPDRILVETDCPYLAPVPLRGKPNEPAYITHTVAVLAALRGETVEALSRNLYANAVRFFRL